MMSFGYRHVLLFIKVLQKASCKAVVHTRPNCRVTAQLIPDSSLLS